MRFHLMLIGALASLCFMTISRNAAAVLQISSCGSTCNVDCELSADLACSGDGVYLGSGASLDLRGHSITCNGCDSNSNVGVGISASSSTVHNSGSQESVISGAFYKAVDCNGLTTTRVSSIRIDGAIFGAWDCRQVDANVFVNTYAPIIDNTLRDSDSVRDNFIREVNSSLADGIEINTAGTNHSVSVDHNVIAQARSNQHTISVSSTLTDVSVTGNVMYLFSTSTSNPISAPSGATFSGNTCTDGNTACSACITAGQCAPITAPYVGP